MARAQQNPHKSAGRSVASKKVATKKVSAKKTAVKTHIVGHALKIAKTKPTAGPKPGVTKTVAKHAQPDAAAAKPAPAKSAAPKTPAAPKAAAAPGAVAPQRRHRFKQLTVARRRASKLFKHPQPLLRKAEVARLISAVLADELRDISDQVHSISKKSKQVLQQFLEAAVPAELAGLAEITHASRLISPQERHIRAFAGARQQTRSSGLLC